MEKQFFIPIKTLDGNSISIQVKQKNFNHKKRKVKTWSAEEDSLLLQLYDNYPKKWAQIAALMNDRNQNQCLHRYRRLSQIGSNKKIWSAEQDQTIKKLMKKMGRNWKVLSEMVGTKTGKQIRERFINKLDPNINKEEWCDEQDRKIIQLYSEIGSRWSQISKKLSGRPQNKIKNRFYSYIKKNYDIKYHVNDSSINNQLVTKQIISNPNYPILVSKQSLKEISDHNLPEKISKIKYKLPSIHDLNINNEEDYEQENVISSKFYLHSLLKVDEQWHCDNKYSNKSIVDFNQPNQIHSDLFYLSQYQ